MLAKMNMKKPKKKKVYKKKVQEEELEILEVKNQPQQTYDYNGNLI